VEALYEFHRDGERQRDPTTKTKSEQSIALRAGAGETIMLATVSGPVGTIIERQ